jgi:hypothetical protein
LGGSFEKLSRKPIQQRFGLSTPNAIRIAAQTKSDDSLPQSTPTAPAPGDEAERHFQKARESLAKRDANTAAAEIREGASFLKLEVNRATGEAKKTLAASEQELGRLADGVESGTDTSVHDLRGAFARAHQALAEEHLQNAVESWSKKEVKKTGRELKLAADNVELAFSWTGQKFNTAAETAVKEAHAVSGKLAEGAGWTRAEVDKELDAMTKEVKKLREQA